LFQWYWYGPMENFTEESGNIQPLVFENPYYEAWTPVMPERSHTIAVSMQNFAPPPIVFIGAGLRGHTSQMQNKSMEIGTFEQRRQNHISHVINAMSKNFTSLGNTPEGLDAWFVKRAASTNRYVKQEDNREVEITSLIDALHILDERFDQKPIQYGGDGLVELSVQDEYKKLSELSSGFMSLLKILQAIISGYGNLTNEADLTKVKGMVFIDEIESHLHSEWQVKIVPTLKRIFSDTTFYVTTHSPLILSQLEEGEAYLLTRGNDGEVVSSVIDSPNKRILVDVLKDAFDVNLNELKRTAMAQSDQSEVKARLLELLRSNKGEDHD
ncbi:MAG: AAA family ATPase, partial [Formosimonas sp.]